MEAKMRFSKLQAMGNDFVVVEAAEIAAGVDPGRLARDVCDRHFGAGADGLVVVEPAVGGEADWRSRIFNADGSEAEVSGNGTRCLAAFLDAAGRWPRDAETVRIATVAGVKLVRKVAGEGTGRRFEMEMGVPSLASDAIPMRLDPPAERVVAHALDVDGIRYSVTALSVGNPHCTLFVRAFDEIDVRAVGPRIEHHPAFPNRVNVEFVRVASRDRLQARFWERGAGETLSSGTGASAALVAAVLNGVAERAATVETPAGELRVVWRASDDVVLLVGPAELVYTARWERALA
jgi:diaminopimelate epimerase